MSILSQKLRFHQANEIHILNKPAIFDQECNQLNYAASLIHTSCVDVVLVFVYTKEEFMSQMLTLFPRLLDSSTLWIAYPKQTTKKAICNLHHEYDWGFLGYYRLKPTRLVRLNSQWNAIKLKKTTV